MFSNIVPSSMAKSASKEKSSPTMSNFFLQNCIFYRIEIRRAVLKQPIRIEYLIKQKPRGVLALQINIGSLAEEKGIVEELGSCQPFLS